MALFELTTGTELLAKDCADDTLASAGLCDALASWKEPNSEALSEIFRMTEVLRVSVSAACVSQCCVCQ